MSTTVAHCEPTTTEHLHKVLQTLDEALVATPATPGRIQIHDGQVSIETSHEDLARFVAAFAACGMSTPAPAGFLLRSGEAVVVVKIESVGVLDDRTIRIWAPLSISPKQYAKMLAELGAEPAHADARRLSDARFAAIKAEHLKGGSR